jgi:hypothetical protein
LSTEERAKDLIETATLRRISGSGFKPPMRLAGDSLPEQATHDVTKAHIVLPDPGAATLGLSITRTGNGHEF